METHVGNMTVPWPAMGTAMALHEENEPYASPEAGKRLSMEVRTLLSKDIV